MSWLPVALAMPKSMIFGQALPSTTETRMFEGLRISMDDRLLVRVLDAPADLDQELEALDGGEALGVAVLGDRDAGHVLHYEVRPALRRASAVEHPGDGGVVHQCQGLPLGLEPGDHLAGVHPGLDQLQGHSSPGLGLLGEPDLAHSPRAQPFEEAVGPDPLLPASRRCGRGCLSGRETERVLESRPAQRRVDGHLDPPPRTILRHANARLFSSRRPDPSEVAAAGDESCPSGGWGVPPVAEADRDGRLRPAASPPLSRHP